MLQIAMDAGGSGTRVLTRRAGNEAGVRSHRADFDSINPLSVGVNRARTTLVTIMRHLAASAQGTPAVGWLATATVGPNPDLDYVHDIRTVAGRLGLNATFLLSNDVVPLLFAPPTRGCGAVLVAGTGSGFWAVHEGHVEVAGGYEYLCSDEGSAFDIGLHGLRRAARAYDGRSSPTRLLDRLAAEHPDLVAFFRGIAGSPGPKQEVARVAAVVTECWLEGDKAAGQIVSRAATDLVQGLLAVRTQAEVPETAPTVLTGGLMIGCTDFADLVAIRARRVCGDHPVSISRSPVEDVAQALARYTADGLDEPEARLRGRPIVHRFHTLQPAART